MKTEETYEDPTCEVWRISLIVIGLLAFFTNGKAQHKQSWIEGAFYTEANYGYNFFGEDRHTIDFPHVILDLTLHLGKGWHFSTEQDVEYLQECGLKPQSFRDMHSCNWAYLQKDLVPEAQLLIGKDRADQQHDIVMDKINGVQHIFQNVRKRSCSNLERKILEKVS